MDGDKKPEVLVATPFDETHAQISPDGKWIAYTSDSTGGRKEVFVQPFPAGTGRWQISPEARPDSATYGGDWARWRHDGKELFYHSLGGVEPGTFNNGLVFRGPIYSVAVTATAGSFEASTPKEIIRTLAMRVPHNSDYGTYGVSADGQKFLVFQRVLDSAVPSTALILPDHQQPGLTVAMNWIQGLKKR
jgi:Tol biopolymer transport system component